MAGLDVRAEHPAEEVGIGRHVLRPEHGIAAGLQVHFDLVPDAGIHVVRAKTLRFAAVRGLRAMNFNVLTERAGMDGFLRQGGASRAIRPTHDPLEMCRRA